MCLGRRILFFLMFWEEEYDYEESEVYKLKEGKGNIIEYKYNRKKEYEGEYIMEKEMGKENIMRNIKHILEIF